MLVITRGYQVPKGFPHLWRRAWGGSPAPPAPVLLLFQRLEAAAERRDFRVASGDPGRVSSTTLGKVRNPSKIKKNRGKRPFDPINHGDFIESIANHHLMLTHITWIWDVVKGFIKQLIIEGPHLGNRGNGNSPRCDDTGGYGRYMIRVWQWYVTILGEHSWEYGMFWNTYNMYMYIYIYIWGH